MDSAAYTPTVTLLPGSDERSIPVPENITGDENFLEIARIWKRKEAGGDRINVMLRQIYDEPHQWCATLATIARTVATTFAQMGGMPMEQADQLAALLLIGGISQIAETNPEIKAENQGDTPGQVAKALMPMALPGMAPTQPVKIDDRAIGVPDEIMHIEGARQVLNVWQVPGTDACPGCGDEHPEKTYLGGATVEMKDEDVGALLAQITSMHAQFKGKSVGDRLKIVALVQKTFFEVLDQGLPRA